MTKSVWLKPNELIPSNPIGPDVMIMSGIPLGFSDCLEILLRYVDLAIVLTGIKSGTLLGATVIRCRRN